MKEWKLSPLDTFCLGMTIKGAWIYSELPSAKQLYTSLEQTLRQYPHLLGHYDEKSKAVLWSGNESCIELLELDLRDHSSSEDMYSLVPKYDINGFKSGKTPALQAYLLRLKDSSALVLQGAHALMDGVSFYSLVREWGKRTMGEQTEPMKTDQSLIPDPDNMSEKQTLAAVQQRGWCKIGFKSLIKMMFNMAASSRIKDTFTLTLPWEEIEKIKKESGAGTNAVLCNYAIGQLIAKLGKKDPYTLIQVADLRGRACEVGENFMGNFSQALNIGSFQSTDGAAEIDAKARKLLEHKEFLTEQVQLSVSASHHSLPYYYFNACEMNTPKPSLIYINNQLKLRACEIEFGTGAPLRAQQAMLPDMIKFWQSHAGGPVEIIYSGFAARTMAKD